MASDFDIALKEFDDWIERLDKAIPLYKTQFLPALLEELGKILLEKTKARTPIQTGDLQRAWKVSKVRVLKTSVSITISNASKHNLPLTYGDYTGYYASFIEYGFPMLNGNWYDGKFMLKLSIDEVLQILPKKYIAEFTQWVKVQDI